MGSHPVTFLWLWPATDHEPHCRHVPVNKIWRWTESTLRSGWWQSHMAGIYCDCSTYEINNKTACAVCSDATLYSTLSTQSPVPAVAVTGPPPCLSDHHCHDRNCPGQRDNSLLVLSVPPVSVSFPRSLFPASLLLLAYARLIQMWLEALCFGVVRPCVCSCMFGLRHSLTSSP